MARKPNRQRRAGLSVVRGGGEEPVVAAGDVDDGRRVGCAEPRGARLDVQGQAVHLVLVQHQAGVLQVVGHLRDVLDLVRHLLEVSHLSDHVGDLEQGVLTFIPRWEGGWGVQADNLGRNYFLQHGQMGKVDKGMALHLPSSSWRS